MTRLSEARKAEMRSLFDENGLTNDDIFQHKHFIIITRSGIEKIQARQRLSVKYEVVKMDRDFVVVKAICTRRRDHSGRDLGGMVIETFGEAGPENCKNAYYVATAEKRALSRAVLKMVGLYQKNVFGEDEGVQDE